MTDPPLFEQPDCCEACGRPFASSRRDDPSTSTEAGDEIDIFEGPVGSIRRGTHRHRLLGRDAECGGGRRQHRCHGQRHRRAQG